MANRRLEINEDVFEEQLFEARQALFSAKSVKQIKFLQNKIKYLEKMIKKRSQF